MCEKVLSQAIHMSNIKALSQIVERELKFFKKKKIMSTVKVNVIRSKLLVCLKRSSRKHMSNMKALCPRVERGLQFFIFFIKVGQRPKSRSSGQNCWYMCGKVLSPAIHMSNIKALSQRVERKLKFFIFL